MVICWERWNWRSSRNSLVEGKIYCSRGVRRCPRLVCRGIILWLLTLDITSSIDECRAEHWLGPLNPNLFVRKRDAFRPITWFKKGSMLWSFAEGMVLWLVPMFCEVNGRNLSRLFVQKVDRTVSIYLGSILTRIVLGRITAGKASLHAHLKIVELVGSIDNDMSMTVWELIINYYLMKYTQEDACAWVRLSAASARSSCARLLRFDEGTSFASKQSGDSTQADWKDRSDDTQAER